VDARSSSFAASGGGIARDAVEASGRLARPRRARPRAAPAPWTRRARRRAFASLVGPRASDRRAR